MASISDIIEQFILDYLNNDDIIELSRNDLAKYFSCVPSQINYVLNTRFTINRGYAIESVRGGAGHIKVIRLKPDKEDYLKEILELIGSELNFAEGSQLLENLCEKNYINERECELLTKAISTKSLINPINMENSIRANILKQIIIEIMKGEN